MSHIPLCHVTHKHIPWHGATSHVTYKAVMSGGVPIPGALANTERVWIVSGCLALLIRLPFSLSIPHFVAETIGALIAQVAPPSTEKKVLSSFRTRTHGVCMQDYERAKWNIICLAVAGTFDAILDFWNYFLFMYASCPQFGSSLSWTFSKSRPNRFTE